MIDPSEREQVDSNKEPTEKGKEKNITTCENEAIQLYPSASDSNLKSF